MVYLVSLTGVRRMKRRLPISRTLLTWTNVNSVPQEVVSEEAKRCIRVISNDSLTSDTVTHFSTHARNRQLARGRVESLAVHTNTWYHY